MDVHRRGSARRRRRLRGPGLRSPAIPILAVSPGASILLTPSITPRCAASFFSLVEELKLGDCA